MTSPQTDRLAGLTTSVAVKAPCRVAAVSNITLSGLQTIDGVTVAADDRVLVTAQTSAVNNGIYKASASSWTRATDFNGSLDVVGGTQIFVTAGTSYAATHWRVTGNGSITPGTDSLSFAQSFTDALGMSFTDTGTGAVAVNLQTLVRSGVVNARSFGATGDGTTDDTTALQNALNAALSQNRILYIPPGTYKVTSTISVDASNYITYTGFAYAPSPIIWGAGVARTILDNRVPSGYLFDFDTANPHTSTFQGLLQGELKDFTITQLAITSGSSGIKIQTAVNFRFENLHIDELTGTGVRIICDQGDLNASIQVLFKHCRIENCGGWGIDVGDAGHNETSFVKLDHTFIQANGTAAEKYITGITKANPAVVTAAAHGFSNGDAVYIGGVEGMTEINSYTAEAQYTVANKTDDTFELSGINSGAYGTFVGTATISGITRANPAVVTANTHGLANGAHISISGVAGMTQINTATSGSKYVIQNKTANTFELRDVDSSAYTAYSSGGTATVQCVAFPAVPTSGGMRWKGQVGEITASGFTINKNVSIYVNGLGGGLPQNFLMEASTVENPMLVGVLVHGVIGLSTDQDQVYNGVPQNGGTPCFWGWLFDGTGNTIKNATLYRSTVRTRSTDPGSYTAFQAFGTNVDKNTIRVRDVTWKEFYNHQTRFRDIQHDPIPQQCVLTVISGTEVRLRPDPSYGRGNKMPIRTRNPVVNSGASALVSDGEWVPIEIDATGLLLTNSGLSGGVAQNLSCYLYASDSVALAGTVEASTIVPVQDTTSGYMVKTGDATRLWVGTVRSTTANAFEVGTSTAGSNWVNPNQISGHQTGVPDQMWVNPADRSLYIKQSATPPTSPTGGDFRFPAHFEYTASYDPPALQAGSTAPSVTTTITSSGVALGDYVVGVSFSLDTQGITLNGNVSATDTVAVTLTNPTTTSVNLSSGTLRAMVIRR